MGKYTLEKIDSIQQEWIQLTNLALVYVESNWDKLVEENDPDNDLRGEWDTDDFGASVASVQVIKDEVIIYVNAELNHGGEVEDNFSFDVRMSIDEFNNIEQEG